MDSKNNTNEENNSSDEIIDEMCSECGSININWQGICHDCLTCSYCCTNDNIYSFEETFIKVYETDSHRGFDFHGCTVEFNENTKLTVPELKKLDTDSHYCYVCMDTKGFKESTEEHCEELTEWNDEWDKATVAERIDLRKKLVRILSDNGTTTVNHFNIIWHREILTKSATRTKT